MIMIILLILLAEICGVAGQILFKKTINNLDAPNMRSHISYLLFLKNVLRVPAVWIGFCFVGLGISIWLIALAQADLSLVFPIDSMQYIITLVAARIFLGEKIDRMKLGGTLLVMAGIALVAIS